MWERVKLATGVHGRCVTSKIDSLFSALDSSQHMFITVAVNVHGHEVSA